MRRRTHYRVIGWGAGILALLTAPAIAAAQDASAPASPPPVAAAQPPRSTNPSLEVYGFAMLDIGHNFNQIHPNWFDTMRVTKLPSFENEFGRDHNAFAGVRQTRFGVRATAPTELGDLRTTFEFELFGTGVDEGQTTFRLRHAYGEVGKFGAGQTWSPFMDPDVFPNSLEYWGPTGMVFFRNVQFRWIPINEERKSLIIGIERPGASADQGVYADRVELEDVFPRFPMPDVSAAYKLTTNWGYFRAAGIVRVMKWDDLNNDQFELSGSDTGWGINLSANLKATTNDLVRLQFVFGEGVQNYMNDAPVDVGVEDNFQNSVTPFVGKALPLTGLVAFVDHTWSPRFTSSFGYSYTDIDNTNSQAPNAFKRADYALGNLLFMPVPNVMLGGELQWGRRENFSDGFSSNAVKIQFSFKYNFSQKFGG